MVCIFIFVTDQWNFLQDLCHDPKCVNPKLVALKKMILDAFKEKPDTYAILFTKTKIATEALKNWLNEDPDLNYLRAIRITGASNEESAGILLLGCVYTESLRLRKRLRK